MQPPVEPVEAARPAMAVSGKCLTRTISRCSTARPSLYCLNCCWLLALAFEGDSLAPGGQAAPVTPGRASTPPASDLKPPAPRPLAAYPETLARPVFFKGRAPYVPPPPAPPPPPPPPASAPPPVDPGLVLGG